MKRLATFLLLVLAVAATAYGISYYLNSRQTEDQWTWLQREFHLSGAQFAQIHALHDAYEPVCAGHCRRIMAAQERLDLLETGKQQGSPEYAAATQEWEALKHECNDATLKHLQSVAAVMNPEDGRRYLAMMVPRVTRHDHREPREMR
jgi:hypothetical protein